MAGNESPEHIAGKQRAKQVILAAPQYAGWQVKLEQETLPQPSLRRLEGLTSTFDVFAYLQEPKTYEIVDAFVVEVDGVGGGKGHHTPHAIAMNAQRDAYWLDGYGLVTVRFPTPYLVGTNSLTDCDILAEIAYRRKVNNKVPIHSIRRIGEQLVGFKSLGGIQK